MNNEVARSTAGTFHRVVFTTTDRVTRCSYLPISVVLTCTEIADASGKKFCKKCFPNGKPETSTAPEA